MSSFSLPATAKNIISNKCDKMPAEGAHSRFHKHIQLTRNIYVLSNKEITDFSDKIINQQVINTTKNIEVTW